MDKGGSWIPVEYRETQSAQLTLRSASVTYKDGSCCFDEVEWINESDEERIKELASLGADDIHFDYGAYTDNEKEEFPLLIEEGAKLYIWDSTLHYLEKVE